MSKERITVILAVTDCWAAVALSYFNREARLWWASLLTVIFAARMFIMLLLLLQLQKGE